MIGAISLARSPMRKTVLLLNAIVIVFFVCFLAYTFIARQHLDVLGREFVTEKTLDYSQPIVQTANAAIDQPIVQKMLSEERVLVIRQEIKDYQNAPAAYVSDLTRQRFRDLPIENDNPLLTKVISIKEKIRTFYDKTLNELITNLRVFSISNLVAGIIAFGFAFRSRPAVRHSLVWFSFLMFVTVLYCSYLYINELTFFRILFRMRVDWWYPFALCVTFVSLYLEFGRHANAPEPRNEQETIDHADSGEKSITATR